MTERSLTLGQKKKITGLRTTTTMMMRRRPSLPV
jgi:hypothetical protein